MFWCSSTSFVIFTNLYLSINTIDLKLSFSYESGKILRNTLPPTEVGKIGEARTPRPSRIVYAHIKCWQVDYVVFAVCSFCSSELEKSTDFVYVSCIFRAHRVCIIIYDTWYMIHDTWYTIHEVVVYRVYYPGLDTKTSKI